MTISGCSWKPVNEKFFTNRKGNIHEIPFMFKTDGTEGSGEIITLQLKDNDSLMGKIRIKFTSPVKYELSNCRKRFRELPHDLPSDVEKVFVYKYKIFLVNFSFSKFAGLTQISPLFIPSIEIRNFLIFWC